MAFPLLAVPHPRPMARGHQEALLPGTGCWLEQRATCTMALVLQQAGLGSITWRPKIPRAASGQAPPCKRFLSLALPVLFVTCQTKSISKFKVGVGGHYQRAGKNLGPILQSAHHRQGAPPSLARRVYWHSLPRATAP